MFRHRKKRKVEPAKEWLELLTLFYAENELTAAIIDHPTELLTYGLGFLSEYLRTSDAKDDEAAALEHEFLKQFGQLNDEQALALRKEINRSTIETKPVLIELIFLGVDSFNPKEPIDFSKRGQEVLELIRSND